MGGRTGEEAEFFPTWKHEIDENQINLYNLANMNQKLGFFCDR